MGSGLGNVNILNTIGVKGELKTELSRLTKAITNGTDAIALNSDGKFELVLFGRSSQIVIGFILSINVLF